jgi:hypothetical protein
MFAVRSNSPEPTDHAIRPAHSRWRTVIMLIVAIGAGLLGSLARIASEAR